MSDITLRLNSFPDYNDSKWLTSCMIGYEIETSNLYRPDADIQHPFDIQMEDEIHQSIQLEAAKFLHNRWVEAKNLDGWRYGTRLNIQEKSHPAMRDWDNLSEAYRKYPTMTKTEALDFYTKYRHLF